MREGDGELVEVMHMYVWAHRGGCVKLTTLFIESKKLEGKGKLAVQKRLKSLTVCIRRAMSC